MEQYLVILQLKILGIGFYQWGLQLKSMICLVMSQFGGVLQYQQFQMRQWYLLRQKQIIKFLEQ